MKYDGGVVIAADTLGSYGSLARFTEIERVIKVNETTMVGAGGDFADFQFLSDIINARVDRPKVLETTALGAAWLAGSRAGIYPDMKGFAATWALDRSFEPSMRVDDRDRKYSAWKRAVNATMSF